MTIAGVAKLSRKQLHSIVEATARVNIWEGAIRSGKTFGSILKWLTYVADPPGGGQLVMVGRTRESLARNVIAPMMDPALFGDIADTVHYATGAPSATILGRRVHMLGASDVKAEKSLRGMTVAGAYVDEVTVIRQDFFHQMLGRMSVPGAQLFGTTNPDNPAHWLKTEYLDRLAQLPDWRSWHFTLDDNHALSDDYKDAIKREYTGLWYRRFILGHWVAADGAVFADWDPKLHTINPADIPRQLRLLSVGVDHGITNPSAAELLGMDRRGNLYTVDEWWMQATGAQIKPTVAQQTASFTGWYRSIHDRANLHGQAAWHGPDWILIDPAAAAFRADLAQSGLPGVGEADNDVGYGLSSMGTLLSSGRWRISTGCTNLIREMPAYSWDTKATERGHDRPIKVADHAIDAARYSILTTENTWRAAMRSQPNDQETETTR